MRDGKIIGKVGIKLTNNDPCPTGRRRRCFICLFYGTSEYATKEQAFEKFLAEKRKRDSACENSSDKRQALNFFECFKKGFCLNKDFILSRISESLKRKPKKNKQ